MHGVVPAGGHVFSAVHSVLPVATSVSGQLAEHEGTLT